MKQDKVDHFDASSGDPQLIARQTFSTDELMTEFPPRDLHPKKKMLYEMACAKRCENDRVLSVSRWRSQGILDWTCSSDPSPGEIELREDLFEYTPDRTDQVVEWYLNFAHSHLFVAYSSELFAQDEIQCAEHPVLPSLREAMLVNGPKPLTVERGCPTPVLIMGAERRCAIDTSINEMAGRPRGLYGNRFSECSEEAISDAVTVLDPPSRTNLIAIEAIPGGSGKYSCAQIFYTLSTAYAGFRAAVIESQADGEIGRNNRKRDTIVHTGFWGCGAYGGNRTLMALLQLIAAAASGVDRLVFHSHNARGSKHFVEARNILDAMLVQGNDFIDGQIAREIESMGFRWGVGDGN